MADVNAVAEKVGEMYAVALNDHAAADPEDVGLGGVHIKTWREAYAEGCKDMASAVGAALVGDEQATYKEAVLRAFNAHRALNPQET